MPTRERCLPNIIVVLVQIFKIGHYKPQTTPSVLHAFYKYSPLINLLTSKLKHTNEINNTYFYLILEHGKIKVLNTINMINRKWHGELKSMKTISLYHKQLFISFSKHHLHHGCRA